MRRGAGPSPEAQHGRDGRSRHADPELQQLTRDAHVAQRGFSLAIRRIRLRVSAASGGRPACDGVCDLVGAGYSDSSGQ
jgi:hypothetical protein